jgi:hypothetical protein
MDHIFQTIDLDGLVKSTLLCDILDDAEVQLRRGRAWVGISDLLRLGLGADGSDHAVAIFEEDFEDVGSYEAAATCVAVRISVPRMLWRGGEGQSELACQENARHRERMICFV